MRLSKVGALAIMLALSGCGNFNSIWREALVGGGKGIGTVISIDAKQRFLTANSDNEGQLRICSEKSPDVFSAYGHLEQSRLIGPSKILFADAKAI